MTTPLISIITPTFNRPRYLPLLHKCVSGQSIFDFEWLILDDSAEPSPYMQELSDPRIRYEFSSERKTIGAKRNYLIEKSRAPLIAHFDDDDFYRQDYLAKMIGALNETDADIVKFYGFFVYSKLYKSFGYWDLTTKLGPHWVWSLQAPTSVNLTENNNADLKDIHLGFGFSYVFKKSVWRDNPFPEIDWNEDTKFMKGAEQRFKLMGVQGRQLTSLHVLHRSNTGRCFPQYLLPHFLTAELFPEAAELLAIDDVQKFSYFKNRGLFLE